MVTKIYLYVVLFATLIMTIGGSVGVFMAVADMVSPAPYYQTFEQYKEMKQTAPTDKTGNEAAPFPSDPELKAAYEVSVEQEKSRLRQQAANRLIKSLAWVIIPFPVFLYFQRKVRKSG